MEETIVSVTSINEVLLEKMFLAGAANLEAHKEWINELNVFPVPDGDTGTNMTLTILSAVKEVNALDELSINSIAKAMSMGSLRGARGNSGVILSQLIRGFAKDIEDKKELNTKILAEAGKKAVETAYKAVMKPKEGTILTVARGASDKALELAETVDDIEEFIEAVVNHAEVVLNQTPELLPVLKEAGVVDSGGQGLLQFLKGSLEGYQGKEISIVHEPTKKVEDIYAPVEDDDTEITFGYCTEFIVNLNKPLSEKEENKIKAFLSSIGDSIVCVNIEDILKIHVHTDEPGNVLQKALQYGSLTRIKIDNMREEYEERKKLRKAKEEEIKAATKNEPKKDFAFISVAAGDGFAEIFRNIGVDYIIEGGQTMNPSTEDMLKAIDSLNADNIFIFPNNSNIILAATQAQNLVENKKVFVIPTKTMPQGISAMISFMSDISAEENEEAMLEAIGFVKSGQVTYAVRDTMIEGKEILENDIIGLGGDSGLAVGKDINSTTSEMVELMTDEDSELISIYFGKDIEEEKAKELADALTAKYPDCDVDLQYGGQPVYYYIISVE